MTIKYKYHKDKGYLISVPAGVPAVEDVKSYFQAVLQDQEINSPFFEVVDFSSVKDFDFGYMEAEALFSLLVLLRDVKGYKGSCLVVENDLTKSMSNILSNVGREAVIQIRTFRTLEDACRYAEYCD